MKSGTSSRGLLKASGSELVKVVVKKGGINRRGNRKQTGLEGGYKGLKTGRLLRGRGKGGGNHQPQAGLINRELDERERYRRETEQP